MFIPEKLAGDCATDRVPEGAFSAVPLYKVGGSGPLANALVK